MEKVLPQIKDILWGNIKRKDAEIKVETLPRITDLVSISFDFCMKYKTPEGNEYCIDDVLKLLVWLYNNKKFVKE
jgi:hypothetical protein